MPSLGIKQEFVSVSDIYYSLGTSLPQHKEEVARIMRASIFLLSLVFVLLRLLKWFVTPSNTPSPSIAYTTIMLFKVIITIA